MTHRINIEIFSSITEHNPEIDFGQWSRDFVAECYSAGLRELPDTFGITVGLPFDQWKRTAGFTACDSPVSVTDCADDIYTAFKRYERTTTMNICTLFFASKVWSDKPFIEIHLIDDDSTNVVLTLIKHLQSIFD